MQRHGAGGVRGAAQARVEGADSRFDPVQYALRDVIAIDIMPCDLGNRTVHCQVVLAGRDQQIDLGDQPIPIDSVVVKQCAARCLTDADPSS